MDVIVVLRAILYRLREGCSWRALGIFGHWRTIYGHWRRWIDLGIWEEILKKVSVRSMGTLWSIDSTNCKVHKHGHGGPKRIDNQDIGRSRGGPNTKIHALVDSRARIVDLFLSPGNRNDIPFAALLCDDAPKALRSSLTRHMTATNLSISLKPGDSGTASPRKRIAETPDQKASGDTGRGIASRTRFSA